MKIGLVCPYNIALGGGVQEIVRALHDELAARGHQVAIVTPQPREPHVDEGRRIIFLGSAANVKTPLNTVAQVSASVLTDEIDSMLEHEQFDILHFHEPWVPVLSRQILSRSNTVNVATFHAKLPETVMSRTMAKVITPYTKPLLRHIDAFTAVSDAAAEYLLSLADVPVEIIPNGINLKYFAKPRSVKRPVGPKTILYVGRLEHRKGVAYLLTAFAELESRSSGVRLIIAGDGVDREKLEQQSVELGLKNVEFLGYIDEATKRRLLHTTDLFCSPALFGESFGVVLLEALAAGLVIVAGDNPGYASVMEGLGQLSLIDPKDASMFAHRLQLLLDDGDLRALWQKWAKDYVRQFDYPKVMDRYMAVYETARAEATKERS
ncbi:MAG TPA: glycosyltransferase family 4 protein [Candidatus Saccharimonadales bacterium]|nr:glycosyltransferase family 4 protein [Candidatus Saccharimonadales bacterium]